MNNPYSLNQAKYSTHNIIAANIGKNFNVLDVGCNTGYIGKISDSSNMFYGLDFVEENVLKAKEIYADAVCYDLNDLKKLPWEQKFDIVVFADVLEHVLHPKAVLDFFVNNYLKSGGKIILSLPNIANWQIRLNLLFGRFNYGETGIMDKTHLHFFTFASAKELAVSTGLDIRKEYGGASFFGPLLARLPFLKKILATNIILICNKF